jgi:uncharacterized protein
VVAELAELVQLAQLVQRPLAGRTVAHIAPLRWWGHRRAEMSIDPVAFDLADFRPALKTQLLVLQPTPFCNLDCDYCYLPDRQSTARMAVQTAARAARRLLEDGLVGDELTVVWHAGEPLVVPVAFYEEAFDAIAAALGSAVKITHSIQTNATLVTDAWCELFLRRGVRVGVSVDGPAEIHDAHRRTRAGRGSHWRVRRGMETLRAHGVPFHAIAVVTSAALPQPDAFYDYFQAEGITELGCNFDEPEGVHAGSTLSGNEEAYRAFLARLLARASTGQEPLRIRELDTAVRLVLERGACYEWRGEAWPYNAQVLPFALVSVGHSGDFCTFSPELLGQRTGGLRSFALGNVHGGGYLSAADTLLFRRQWGEVLAGMRDCRSRCPHFNFCGGGAPVNKLAENGTMASGETLYCRTMVKTPLELVLQQMEQRMVAAQV